MQPFRGHRFGRAFFHRRRDGGTARGRTARGRTARYRTAHYRTARPWRGATRRHGVIRGRRGREATSTARTSKQGAGAGHRGSRPRHELQAKTARIPAGRRGAHRTRRIAPRRGKRTRRGERVRRDKREENRDGERRDRHRSGERRGYGSGGLYGDRLPHRADNGRRLYVPLRHGPPSFEKSAEHFEESQESLSNPTATSGEHGQSYRRPFKL
jgi:hypothetical protein